jgi:DNA-binding NtrC family response regulator
MANDKEQPVILIVDDEEIVTTSLRNLFRLRTDYRTVTYTSPAQALDESKDTVFDLVISDYLMPGMDGIKFLSQFKKLQPQAIRILLTGYADKENAILAINEVGLYQYVEKPWDNAALLMIVKNALEKAALLRTLEQKVRELQAVNASLRDFQNELIRTFI